MHRSVSRFPRAAKAIHLSSSDLKMIVLQEPIKMNKMMGMITAIRTNHQRLIRNSATFLACSRKISFESACSSLIALWNYLGETHNHKSCLLRSCFMISVFLVAFMTRSELDNEGWTGWVDSDIARRRWYKRLSHTFFDRSQVPQHETTRERASWLPAILSWAEIGLDEWSPLQVRSRTEANGL